MSRQAVAPPSSVLARLRFRHLQLLDVLGRTRNLRAAAEQLHITQPAATKILSDIEGMLQAKLFERLPRDMCPTDLGLFAVRYASTAVADLGKFVSELETLRAGGHGHLTVGAISASAAQVVTAGIREILQKRPRLVIRLVEQSSDQLAVWLEEKKLDIMVGRLTEPRQQAIFDFEVLSPEPVWVVCKPDHPLLAQARPELADLAEWPWILYPPATAIRQLFEETFAAAGIRSLVGMVETPSIFSTLELLQATEMLSLQPRAAVEKYVGQGLLGRVPVPIRRAMTSYGIVTRKNELRSEAMDAFVEILRTVARQQGTAGDAMAPVQDRDDSATIAPMHR
ncbi:LysR substrate-binding domain-containing protein [Cupriavidus sp. WKF15]|uniref:LysR substrate-binding domain-containing protein n=1 Tax=Cupriavidus sp. WKF15 TaxID=3032282 RepID=UPI0023E1F3E0|nr:LysR substrate-binding domain-containing protein [Cupriavidus sp. WKF15]WER45484.1 LysR substrate-binding domain-containing protein [Cupriavidus sp. WKF15]